MVSPFRGQNRLQVSEARVVGRTRRRLQGDMCVYEGQLNIHVLWRSGARKTGCFFLRRHFFGEYFPIEEQCKIRHINDVEVMELIVYVSKIQHSSRDLPIWPKLDQGPGGCYSRRNRGVIRSSSKPLVWQPLAGQMKNSPFVVVCV